MSGLPLILAPSTVNGDGAFSVVMADEYRPRGGYRSQSYCGAGVVAGGITAGVGIVPYGVADTINYRLWVSEPPLPESVIDVGLRTEPNLDADRNETVVYGLARRIWPFTEKCWLASCWCGFNFSDGKQPLAMARKSLTEMADLLTCKAQQKRI